MSSVPSVRLPRDARRRQLLDAAREVFVETGFHAASMDDIATRAGVTKPVLYQHFGSKRDLYLAVLDQGSEFFLAAMKDALSSTNNNQDRVRAALNTYLEFMSRDDAAYRLVFESDLVNAPDVRERVDRIGRTGAQIVSQIIRDDTDLSDEESNLLAYGLLGLAQSAAQRYLTGHESMSITDAGKLLTALAWRGISGFPRKDGTVAT